MIAVLAILITVNPCALAPSRDEYRACEQRQIGESIWRTLAQWGEQQSKDTGGVR